MHTPLFISENSPYPHCLCKRLSVYESRFAEKLLSVKLLGIEEQG